MIDVSKFIGNTIVGWVVFGVLVLVLLISTFSFAKKGLLKFILDLVYLGAFIYGLIRLTDITNFISNFNFIPDSIPFKDILYIVISVIAILVVLGIVKGIINGIFKKAIKSSSKNKISRTITGLFGLVIGVVINFVLLSAVCNPFVFNGGSQIVDSNPGSKIYKQIGYEPINKVLVGNKVTEEYSSLTNILLKFDYKLSGEELESAKQAFASVETYLTSSNYIDQIKTNGNFDDAKIKAIVNSFANYAKVLNNNEKALTQKALKANLPNEFMSFAETFGSTGYVAHNCGMELSQLTARVTFSEAQLTKLYTYFA